MPANSYLSSISVYSSCGFGRLLQLSVNLEVTHVAGPCELLQSFLPELIIVEA